MKFDPQRHHRRSIRLKGFDYTQPGGYFITMVTQERECLFGEVIDGEMVLNDAGKMIAAEWAAIPARFPSVELETYVIMPNHFHAIVILRGIPNVGADLVSALLKWATTRVAPTNIAPTNIAPTNIAPTDIAPTDIAPTDIAPTDIAPTDAAPRDAAPTLGAIVGAFKSITTHAYIQGVERSDWPRFDKRLWQRNYYEHIIRSNSEYGRIARYIEANPARWTDDQENAIFRKS